MNTNVCIFKPGLFPAGSLVPTVGLYTATSGVASGCRLVMLTGKRIDIYTMRTTRSVPTGKMKRAPRASKIQELLMMWANAKIFRQTQEMMRHFHRYEHLWECGAIAPPTLYLYCKPSGLAPTFVNTFHEGNLLMCAACVNKHVEKLLIQ